MDQESKILQKQEGNEIQHQPHGRPSRAHRIHIHRKIPSHDPLCDDQDSSSLDFSPPLRASLSSRLDVRDVSPSTGRHHTHLRPFLQNQGSSGSDRLLTTGQAVSISGLDEMKSPLACQVDQLNTGDTHGGFLGTDCSALGGGCSGYYRPVHVHYKLPELAKTCEEMTGPTETSNWMIKNRVLMSANPGDAEPIIHFAKLKALIQEGLRTFVCLQDEPELMKCFAHEPDLENLCHDPNLIFIYFPIPDRTTTPDEEVFVACRRSVDPSLFGQ